MNRHLAAGEAAPRLLASGTAPPAVAPPPATATAAAGTAAAQPGTALWVGTFESFYREVYEPVARALAYTLGDVELAREATDEAMVRAYARWSSVQGYDNAAGWVYRVGLNWARSVRRRVVRALPAVLGTVRPDAATAPPPLADPRLRAALLALDVELRSVVVCRVLLDWSVEQTADALHVRPGTVKSRLHRALDRLGRSLHTDPPTRGDDPL
jgi:RNA polymerase sigma-70 factor (ECF subfamily)